MRRSRIYRLFGLVAALAATSSLAQQPSWKDRRLDGSSTAKLEASVAALQSALPARRREEFDVALATIWIQRTAESGDLDADGDLDVDDLRRLEREASALLTQIRRGNLVYAIEQREPANAAFTAADYFAALDGLGYDAVLDLAGRSSAEAYRDAALRTGSPPARNAGESPAPTSRIERRKRPADRFAMSTGRALNTAIEALKEGQYAAAKAAVGTLDPERLSPYESSKRQQVLFAIASAEGDLAAARTHLLLALEARGLDAQETTIALEQLRFLESRLSPKSQ